MRILTYNIHGWRTTDGRPNLTAIGNLIEATRADMVGLNEVYYPRVVEGSAEPALEALAKRLEMHFVFGPCLRWPAQENMPADAYGNAFLSRWPIIASAAHHLTPKEEDKQNVLADKERGLLEARILLPNKQTFTVYVTHLDHTYEEARRLVQLRAARTWLTRDRNRPHLVMGDFNAVSLWDYREHQAALTALAQHPKGHHMADEKGPRVIAQMEKAGYTDIYQLFGAPGVRSFIVSDEPIRIDYFFASQSLVPFVKSCVIWPEPAGQEASDHRPVLAEIEIGE